MNKTSQKELKDDARSDELAKSAASVGRYGTLPVERISRYERTQRLQQGL